MPQFSIIMPVYNSEKYLSVAIKCIINQTYKDWELILIDDGSTDSSASICDNYVRKDKRIKVIHQKNQGICQARNRGLEEAVGIYIAFMDNDDICDPLLLEKSLEIAEEYHADIVKFGRESLVVNDKGQVLAPDIRNLEFREYNANEIRENFLRLRIECVLSPVWDGIYRKSFIDKNGIIFDSNLRYGEEDTIFSMQCVAKADMLVLMEGVYYTHYIRLSHSTSAKFTEEALLKYVVSGQELVHILKGMKIEYKSSIEYIHAYLSNTILQIFLTLVYPSCSYTYIQKKNFLKYVKKNKDLEYQLSINVMLKLLKYDYRKLVFAVLWKCRLYMLLFELVKLYYKEEILYRK